MLLVFSSLLQPRREVFAPRFFFLSQEQEEVSSPRCFFSSQEQEEGLIASLLVGASGAEKRSHRLVIPGLKVQKRGTPRIHHVQCVQQGAVREQCYEAVDGPEVREEAHSR